MDDASIPDPKLVETQKALQEIRDQSTEFENQPCSNLHDSLIQMFVVVYGFKSNLPTYSEIGSAAAT